MGIIEKARSIIEANLRELEAAAPRPSSKIRERLLEIERTLRDGRFSLVGLERQAKKLDVERTKAGESLESWRKKIDKAEEEGCSDIVNEARNKEIQTTHTLEQVEKNLSKLKKHISDAQKALSDLQSMRATYQPLLNPKEGELPLAESTGEEESDTA